MGEGMNVLMKDGGRIWRWSLAEHGGEENVRGDHTKSIDKHYVLGLENVKGLEVGQWGCFYRILYGSLLSPPLDNIFANELEENIKSLQIKVCRRLQTLVE